VAHAAFDEEQHEAANAVEEADDDSDLNNWSDGPDPDEQVAKQEAILASYESMKKTKDDPRSRKEANKEQWHRVVDASIQQAQIEESTPRLFAKEQ
jgi:hypothetical protein